MDASTNNTTVEVSFTGVTVLNLHDLIEASRMTGGPRARDESMFEVTIHRLTPGGMVQECHTFKVYIDPRDEAINKADMIAMRNYIIKTKGGKVRIVNPFGHRFTMATHHASVLNKLRLLEELIGYVVTDDKEKANNLVKHYIQEVVAPLNRRDHMGDIQLTWKRISTKASPNVSKATKERRDK